MELEPGDYFYDEDGGIVFKTDSRDWPQLQQHLNARGVFPVLDSEPGGIYFLKVFIPIDILNKAMDEWTEQYGANE